MTQGLRTNDFGGTRNSPDTTSACINPALLSRLPEQRANYCSDHSSDDPSEDEICLPNKRQKLPTAELAFAKIPESDAAYEILMLKGEGREGKRVTEKTPRSKRHL
jgi:hypothetical protein